ncbi:uncharacterized protein IUM83_17657 [Phytophthora cinnamomi]|uniref:uncharacterized protein n=1 Tax=Phytophthora cinnamomi TaxID=4785 RepID=UPI00355A0507|nr:hypothetical protein IUM83_17657 [Phytophthora cinnamomi]
MNARLKETLEKQWRVSNKLKGMIFKRNVFTGMDFVRSFESPYYGDAHFTFDQSSMLMEQLQGEVESVYRRFNKVYRPQNGPTPFSISQTLYNETCELNVMEFETTTPLGWPMKAAFDHVWASLQSSSNRSRKSNTVETKVNGTLSLHGSSYHFHKLHFLRKFESNDRIIVIWSDLLQMTTKNLRFRSQAYAVFARSKMDPFNSCVMYTNLKLSMYSPADEQNLSPEDVQHAHDTILRGMGRLMREFWQSEQNQLLDLTSGSVA